MYLITFLNPGIFSVSALGTLRWIVLLAAASRIFLDYYSHGLRIKAWLLWLVAFCMVAGLLSAFVSPSPTVSYFKLLAFFIGFVTVMQALAYSRDYDWLSFVFTVWSVVLLMSVPLLFFGVGYIRNGVGFQGILNQPQAYGVFFAVPAIYFSVGYLLRELKRDIKLTLFLLIVWPTVVASQARTGVFAGVLALAFSTGWVLVRNLQSGHLVIRARLRPLTVFLAGLIVALIPLFWNELGKLSVTFVAKTSLSGVNELSMINPDELLRGRTDVIATSWDNFLDHPLSGIGFGVPSNPYETGAAGGEALGIPTSAPVEKSFVPTAVLEENGLLGASVFVGFLTALAIPVLRFGRFSTVVLFMTAFFTNLGEMVFFSAGGGVYIWFCLGLAILFAQRDRQRKRRRQKA